MTRKIRRVSKFSLAASIAVALLPAIAVGQTSNESDEKQRGNQAAQGQTDNKAAQTSTLEEVTVTAQRYGTSLQKTPVSVTALTPETLADRQIITVQDLTSSIPGVQLSQNTSPQSQMKVTFRGARTETGGIRSNGTVGIYIDDVIQPRPMGSFFDLADVDQVEALRGPQGTLYGRNTSGGAIKLRTKLPAYYWTGLGEVGAGSFNGRSGKMYVSGPLIEDKLAFSFSGSHKEREGYIYGLQRERRVGNQDNSAQRFKLLYQPTEKVAINLSVYGIQDHSESNVTVALANLPGVVNPYVFRGRKLTFTEMDQNLNQKILQRGASLTANWEVTPNLTLDTISGYGSMGTYSQGNNTFMTAAIQAANGGRLDLRANTEAFLGDKWYTQEFNLLYTGERIEAVGGLFYFREKGWTQGHTAGVATDLQKSLVTAPAAFAQVTYLLGGGVSLVGGLRFTQETNNYYSHNFSSPDGVQLGRSVFTSTTPKLGVNWQVNPNLFTYASWTQGTRSGGFNTRDLSGALNPSPYGAEWVDSYELGAKFQTSDNKFRLNTTLFQADYSDMQLVRILAGPGYVALFYDNAGGTQVRGLELESNWRVNESLSLYAVMAFQHGKYTKPFNCFNQRSQLMDCSKNKLKGVPAEKSSIGFNFTPRLNIPGKLTFNGAWDHTAKLYNHSANPLPPPDDYGPTPRLNLFNASVRWVDDSNRWHASLEGRNLTNKSYVEHGYTSSNRISPGVVGYLGAPRETWVRVGYSF